MTRFIEIPETPEPEKAPLQTTITENDGTKTVIHSAKDDAEIEEFFANTGGNNPAHAGRFVQVDSFDPQPVVAEGVKCDVVYDVMPDDEKEKSLQMVLNTPLIVPGSLDKMVHGGVPVDEMTILAAAPSQNKVHMDLITIMENHPLMDQGTNTDQLKNELVRPPFSDTFGIKPAPLKAQQPSGVVRVHLTKNEYGYQTFIDDVLQTDPDRQCRVDPETAGIDMPVFPPKTMVMFSYAAEGGKIFTSKILDGSTGEEYDKKWQFSKPAKPAKTNRVQKSANVRAKNAKKFLANNPFFKAKK